MVREDRGLGWDMNWCGLGFWGDRSRTSPLLAMVVLNDLPLTAKCLLFRLLRSH